MVLSMHTLEHLPPQSLAPYKANARTHSKRQIKQIARSIESFGFNNPVLIDDARGIIAGHGRVEAALLLNMETVPCLRLSHLNEAQKRAYIIADNQLAAKAGWDRDILAIELQGLVDIGIDVTVTGFEIAEVDCIVDDYRAKQTDDDEPPLPAPGPAVTRAGDLWRCGAHSLICADARDPNTYAAFMGDERADLVFTDPPYNVPIQGFVGGKGRIKHREFAEGSGELSEQQFIDFLRSTLGLACEHSVDGAIHFVFMDWRHAFEITSAGRAIYDELKNVIVWVKDNAGMGSFYRSQHELIFVFKKGEAAHINTFELGQFGRSRSNVWRYAGLNSIKADRLQELAMHPTVKPLALVADAIKDCSKQRGLVLDPFGGSGTTLIAAEKTGRRARLIEIDPLYCDVIVRRWQAFTGKRATLAATGQSFDDVESVRCAKTELEAIA
jgi:DNA modification methylase